MLMSQVVVAPWRIGLASSEAATFRPPPSVGGVAAAGGNGRGAGVAGDAGAAGDTFVPGPLTGCVPITNERAEPRWPPSADTSRRWLQRPCCVTMNVSAKL